MRPLIIGLAGGTASGKTTACNRICHQLPEMRVLILSMDRFYYSLPESVDASTHNFDVPTAYDFPLLRSILEQLCGGNGVKLPIYCYTTHQRLSQSEDYLGRPDVIIIEGILALYDEEIRRQMDLTVYIDVSEEIRLSRRIERDTSERGRTLQSVIDQYLKTVKSAHETYVEMTSQVADIVVRNNGVKDQILSGLLVSYIRDKICS